MNLFLVLTALIVIVVIYFIIKKKKQTPKVELKSVNYEQISTIVPPLTKSVQNEVKSSIEDFMKTIKTPEENYQILNKRVEEIVSTNKVENPKVEVETKVVKPKKTTHATPKKVVKKAVKKVSKPTKPTSKPKTKSKAAPKKKVKK